MPRARPVSLSKSSRMKGAGWESEPIKVRKDGFGLPGSERQPEWWCSWQRWVVGGFSRWSRVVEEFD